MARATKVDPAAWYTLQDIVRGRMFPWVKSFETIRNLVARDRGSKNILRATVGGEGRGTKYHIKGENIIKFVKQFEAGTTGPGTTK